MVVGMQHQQQEPHASPATVLEDATTPCSVSSPISTPAILRRKLPDKMDCCVVDENECSLTTTTTTETKDLPGTTISNKGVYSSSKMAKSAAAVSCGTRAKLKEVNEHLICVLCNGYFIDATTIAECLHSFCRSCVILYLASKNLCPKCGVEINNSKPDTYLKPDHQLQDIVYKLVPGLFHAEMKRRNLFYQDKPDRDADLLPEYRGVTVDGLVYSLEDNISFSLEYYDTLKEKEDWENKGSHRVPFRTGQTNNVDSDGDESTMKRYFKCPAAVRVIDLKKLIVQKYNLRPNHKVELIHRRESLPDDYSLMDLAYIYAWKRNSPLPLYFRISIATSIARSLEKKCLKKLEAVAAVQSSQPSSKNVLCENGNLKIENIKEEVKSDTDTIDIKNEPELPSKPSTNGNMNDGTSVSLKSESRCEIKTFHKKPSLQPVGTTIANRPKQPVTNGTVPFVADPSIGNANAEKSKSTSSAVVQELTKKSKSIKTSVSSSNSAANNADSLSTTVTQASPIKSYLTISSIDQTDPDLKLAATAKNTNVRNSRDDIGKKITVGDTTPTVSPPVVIKITRTTTTSSNNTTVVSTSTPVMSMSELSKESAVSKLSKSKDIDKLSSASKTIIKQNSTVSMTKEVVPPVKIPSPTVESPALLNTPNAPSIPPPPLVTLTTVPSTVTSASNSIAKNASYLLPNTKIPSSLEISVAQAKDSTPKVNNASVLSMHRVISPPKQNTSTANNTNASQPVTNGQSKQAESVMKKASLKRTSDNNIGQATEKYPALSISKTTITSAASRYKPNEIILSTNEKSDSNKTIFSPSMPNILPEVSITLNRNPEPPSKRLRPETSYDVSCFKPTEIPKKESVCNGVPPLTPIITSCKNIQNSPIKSLNKFVQPTNHTQLMGKNQPVNKNQPPKVDLIKGVAIKRSSGASDSIPNKRAAIENGSSLSTAKTNGTAKVSNGNAISSTTAKSNTQDVASAAVGKKESSVGRHLSMPKLIDIHTSQYFQMKAAQSAKGRVSQQFANAMSNGNAPTILYVKPPPLGEGNNDALDLSPTSKSPNAGCNSDSQLLSSQQQQSNQQQQLIENKKPIPSIPPLIPKILPNVGKNADCKSLSMAMLPKLERKISPIMKATDKKTSPSGLHNRKVETKSSNLSPLKTSPSENCKSPVSTSLAATHSSPTKSLPSPIMATANLGGWPVPVPFHPAMIPVQFYGMPSWLNSYQGPLPGHPLMGDRINPPTSTHQQAGMR